MTISAKGRYAMRMMIDLVEHEQEGWVSLKAISGRQGISAKYMEQIVTPLVRGGFLMALRGAQGGYRLARPAESITAWDVLDTVAGPLSPVRCLQEPHMDCPRMAECRTVDLWRGLDHVMHDYLTSHTLADLAQP